MILGMPLSLLDDVRKLTPTIRALAGRIEQDRALPEEVVGRLAELGVFRLGAPLSAGGLEASAGDMVEVFEEIGYADGSAGWCAMIAGATSMALGHFSPATGQEMLADPRFLIAGVAAPSGVATVVEGGYRVSGRWSFASASRQATWLVGGCQTARTQTTRTQTTPARTARTRTTRTQITPAWTTQHGRRTAVWSRGLGSELEQAAHRVGQAGHAGAGHHTDAFRADRGR